MDSFGGVVRTKPAWIEFNSEWWERRHQTMRTDYSSKMVCHRERQKKWWAILRGKWGQD